MRVMFRVLTVAMLLVSALAVAPAAVGAGDYLSIETAADGNGTVVGDQGLTAGSSLTVYAIERDSEDEFVDNVAADWTLPTKTGGVVDGDLAAAGDNKSATFTGHHVGTAVIHAEADSLDPGDSGTITVNHGAATQMKIENAADGSGTEVDTQTVTAGNTYDQMWAIERDGQGNFVSAVVATWALWDRTEGVVDGDLVPGVTTAAFHGHGVGTAVIHAAYGTFTDETGTFTVVHGAAASLSIESAADNSGSPVDTRTVTAGDLFHVYALERDGQGNFIANVAATWSLTNKNLGVVDGDLVPAGDNKSATFTGHHVGTAVIHADDGSFTDDTGTITVNHDTASVLSIETAANGSGSTIIAQDLTAGHSLGPVYAIERDSEGNFVDNVSATWSMTNVTGGVVTGDLSGTSGTSVSLNAHHVGTGTIHAAANARTAETATITVVADTASVLSIETAGDGTGSVVGSPTLSIGVALPLYAIERDAEGNFVANVSVTWSVTGTLLIGDLSATSGATTTFTGSTVSSGTIHAAGAFAADTGTIHVVTGHSPPGPPTDVHVTPAKGRATVSWLAPTYTGGIPLTGFTVTAHAAGHTDGHCSTDGSTLTCVVELLGNVQYSFTVVAKNAEFDSDPSSPAVLATPTAATVPGVATNVTGLGLDSSVAVSWTAPADDGGRAITTYHVSTYVLTSGTYLPDAAHYCDNSGTSCTVTGLTNNKAYEFTVMATNAIGAGTASDKADFRALSIFPGPQAYVSPHVGSTYVPLTPNRILDTTTDLGQAAPIVHQYGSTIHVANQFPLDATKNVPANAVAITGVLSVRNPSALGFVSVTKTAVVGSKAPISTINFPAHDNRSTGITAPLAADGTLGIDYWATPGAYVDVTLDITGYFIDGTAASRYLPVAPYRLFDTRTTRPALTTGLPRSFKVRGGQLPDSASTVGVVGTLTVTNQQCAGYFSIGPDSDGDPGTSALWFVTADNRATTLTLKLDSSGFLWVRYTATGLCQSGANVSTAKADVIFDVLGFFQSGNSGYMYVPVVQARIWDTRYIRGGTLRSQYAYTFLVRSTFKAYDNSTIDLRSAVAVTGTLTVTQQTYKGYLTLTKDYSNTSGRKTGQPPTSTLNFPKGDNRATGVTVPINTSIGRLGICYWASLSTATTQAIFDVTGYFV